ncbi:hypothetical protein ACRALDRAFT_206832 [Sodiomyces alcalophilus JCM 7366]|uniref:uncharacterized protein n=1 Tax=Sodiomyces alcalophilus JCM 7366 TaxID=591952 RepID=UPI0039B5026C
MLHEKCDADLLEPTSSPNGVNNLHYIDEYGSNRGCINGNNSPTPESWPHSCEYRVSRHDELILFFLIRHWLASLTRSMVGAVPFRIKPSQGYLKNRAAQSLPVPMSPNHHAS